MWSEIRRNAVTVWQNAVLAKRLERYRAIVDLRLPARFQIAKHFDTPFDPGAELRILWRTHTRASRGFRQLLSSNQPDMTYPDLPLPEQSFLDLKAAIALKMIQECSFCERRCGVDRRTRFGFCGVASNSYVASAFLHTGEEPPLVPSGTVFFSGCNLRCAHCQNADISTNPHAGSEVSEAELSAIADELACQGAKNINYVGGDPTPNLHTILASLKHQQYNITQLWNSNMYLTPEAMNLLLDVIDFWLPDLKYFSDTCAERISDVRNYTNVVTRNIRTAYDRGTKEMIIRILVLPNHLECCVFPSLDWIAKNTPEALVNLMGQYHPAWLVSQNPDEFPDIARRVSREEMVQAYARAEELGLEFRPVS
jgi:putative pyruvate formate lyase activating enzyme